MIISFFLIRLYKKFFFCCIALAFFLMITTLLMRLSVIYDPTLLPFLIGYMLLGLSSYIIPLASCFSVQLVCVEFFSQTDQLLFLLFKRLRNSFIAAVFLFSTTVLAIFIPSIFFFVPSSQEELKKLLVTIATQHIEHYEPGIFHQPARGVSLWFEHKQDGPLFYHVLLTIPIEHDASSVIFVSESASVINQKIILHHSTAITKDKSGNVLSSAYFEQMELSLKQLYDPLEKEEIKPAKSMNLTELCLFDCKKNSIMLEFNKRLSQSLWVLILPFLGLLSTLLWGLQQGRGLFIAFSSSGAFFFVSYISCLWAQAFGQEPILGLIVLYAPLIIISAALLLLYFYKS